MLPLTSIGAIVVGVLIGAGVYYLITNITFRKGKRK
jgi:NhaP-type Na+/H+ or K+/H+ antiporter